MVAAISEMGKAAAQQVFSGQKADVFGVGGDVGGAGSFLVSMADDYGRHARSEEGLYGDEVAKDDAIGIEITQDGLNAFEAVRFPIKGPGTVEMGVVGNATE